MQCTEGQAVRLTQAWTGPWDYGPPINASQGEWRVQASYLMGMWGPQGRSTDEWDKLDKRFHLHSDLHVPGTGCRGRCCERWGLFWGHLSVYIFMSHFTDRVRGDSAERESLQISYWGNVPSRATFHSQGDEKGRHFINMTDGNIFSAFLASHNIFSSSWESTH